MFFNARKKKTGRPGWFGDVMVAYTSLHHQVDQAFPIFSHALKNLGRSGYEAKITHLHKKIHNYALCKRNLCFESLESSLLIILRECVGICGFHFHFIALNIFLPLL